VKKECKKSRSTGARKIKEHGSAKAKAQNLRPKKERESASTKSFPQERESASTKPNKKGCAQLCTKHVWLFHKQQGLFCLFHYFTKRPVLAKHIL
jgi:hypothetical protein